MKKIIAAVLVFISRFNILPFNLSPLGTFGFFSQNIFLYFAVIVIFDIIKSGFYQGFIFTYLGFLAYFVFGKLAKKNWKRQAALLPLASFTFFLVSNFGVWLYWYPHTLNDLIACYALALPFYKNTLMGDFLFGYGWLVVKNFKAISWQKEAVKV